MSCAPPPHWKCFLLKPCAMVTFFHHPQPFHVFLLRPPHAFPIGHFNLYGSGFSSFPQSSNSVLPAVFPHIPISLTQSPFLLLFLPCKTTFSKEISLSYLEKLCPLSPSHVPFFSSPLQGSACSHVHPNSWLKCPVYKGFPKEDPDYPLILSPPPPPPPFAKPSIFSEHPLFFTFSLLRSFSPPTLH